MFANRYTVVFDACVLAPPANRDLILCLAEAKFFRPQWSQKILSEAENAIAEIIVKRRPETADAAAKARRVVEQMSTAFPEAAIDAGYEVYEQSLDLPDPNDRHVLAAAIHCRASTIVTDNLKDFPASELARHGIEAKSADDFIAEAPT